MVWVGLSEGPYRRWLAPSGRRIVANMGEQTVVLTGVKGRSVLVNDPLYGVKTTWPKAKFERMWSRLGRRALSYPAWPPAERREIMARKALAGAVLGALLLVSGCGGSNDKGASGAEFDRAFIDAMVPHHRGAIDMSRTALDNGLSQPQLVTIANDILRTQQAEIDQMLQWREDWFGSPDLDPVDPDALGVSEDAMGMEHDSSALSGPDVDTAFAQMMVTHHKGAIEMAKAASERAEREELKTLAGRIIEAQEREIKILRPHASGAMEH